MAFRVAPQRQQQPPTPVTPSMPSNLPLPLVPDSFTPLPMTPPDPEGDWSPEDDTHIITTGLHVLATDRIAFQHIEKLYALDPMTQKYFAQTVKKTVDCVSNHGKVVVCGVGKSGAIGQKIVATMNSLGILSVFLHPTEALHGDLGIIRPNDIILFVSFSGRTQELLHLLQYISLANPIIGLTDHPSIFTCPLFSGRNSSNSFLLPAPIHEPEIVSFGVAAPMTSTTVAVAVGDTLAMTVAKTLERAGGRAPADIFKQNHPGGAIGASIAQERPPRMADIATAVDSVPIAVPRNGLALCALDVLQAAVRSPRGWVRTDVIRIVAPRSVQTFKNMDQTVKEMMESRDSPVVEKCEWISLPGSSTIDEVRDWISRMRAEPRGRTFLRRGTILGIVDAKGEVSGVVEIEQVVGEDFGLVGGLGGSVEGAQEAMEVQ